MIRPTTANDVDKLVALAQATGMFTPMEIDALRDVYDDFFDGVAEEGDTCLTLVEDGEVTGFTYFGPDNIAVGSWELWWIVVDSRLQGKGRGGLLLRRAESMALAEKCRQMFLDTSSQPKYEPTRQFYAKYGYEQEAVLRDYYAPGDDKVIFRRVLTSAPASP
jgi:GNAT superfamily N-acetyltransferase